MHRSAFLYSLLLLLLAFVYKCPDDRRGSLGDCQGPFPNAQQVVAEAPC